jgi:hypothetical protein
MQYLSNMFSDMNMHLGTIFVRGGRTNYILEIELVFILEIRIQLCVQLLDVGFCLVEHEIL